MLVVEKDISRKAVWREYKPGVSVKIRPMLKDRFRELMKQATEKVQVFEQGRKVIKEKLDNDLVDKLTERDSIEDWDGIYFPDGTKVEVNDANIELVCTQLNEFSAWVIAEAFALGDAEAERKGAALKNSQASHDGSESAQKA